jgi:hypothetical protein
VTVKLRKKMFLKCMIECTRKAFDRLVVCSLKSVVTIGPTVFADRAEDSDGVGRIVLCWLIAMF